jgi:hypothetical protein
MNVSRESSSSPPRAIQANRVQELSSGSAGALQQDIARQQRSQPIDPDLASLRPPQVQSPSGIPASRPSRVQIRLAALRQHATQLAASGAPRAPDGYFNTARNGVVEAMRRGVGVEKAVEQGLSRLTQVAGRPMANRDDLAALRQHATQLAASGGPRAPDADFYTAQNSVVEAMRGGADVEKAVQEGLRRFAVIASYPMTHPDDLAALRQHATQLAASGGPRAPDGHFYTARNSVVAAVQGGADVEKAVQEGLRRIAQVAGYQMTHPDDLAALRRAAREELPNGA